MTLEQLEEELPRVERLWATLGPLIVSRLLHAHAEGRFPQELAAMLIAFRAAADLESFAAGVRGAEPTDPSMRKAEGHSSGH